MKIRNKLFLILLAIGFLPAAIFGFLNIEKAQQELKTQILSKLLAVAESKEGQVYAFLDDIEARAADFASDGFVRDSLQKITEQGSKEAAGALNRHLLLNKLPLDASVAGILVMDTKGNIVAATDEKLIGDSEAKDEYFIKGLKGTASTELRGEEHFGLRDSFAASSPITDAKTGKVLGVITIFFKTDELQDIISGKFQAQKGALTSIGGIDKTLEIYIVDGEKRMFVHPTSPHHEELMQRAAKMFVDTEPVKRCLEQNGEILGTYNNYADEAVLGASMCFTEKKWTLLTEIHATEAFAAVNGMWLFFGFASLGLFALITAAALFFGYRIFNPIKKLQAGAEIIGAGDLNHRLDIKTKDEIGQLGKAFNRMAEGLQQITRGFKEEQARLAAAIKSLSLGFVLIGKDNSILMKNPAAGEILGLKENDVSIQAISAVLKEKFDIASAVAEVVKGSKSVEVRDVEYGKKFLHIFLAPVVMMRDHNEIIGCIILIEDSTESKLLERAREEFFAVASHELRTPLTAIRGNMSLIKENYADKIKDKDVMEMVDDSYGASVRLIGIVNDFLDASSLEVGKTKLKIEKVDMAELVKEFTHDVNGRLQSKNLALKLALPEGPVWASADKDRAKQILFNLLGNAINYTQKGEIKIELKKDGAFCQINVSDTGVGISPQNQNLLFRKFQQAGEKVLARDLTQGSGLGLYISKLLVDAMGGKIGLLKSELGKGSTFYFTLPVV